MTVAMIASRAATRSVEQDKPKMSIQHAESCILVTEVMGAASLPGKLGKAEADRVIERCRNRAERSVESQLGSRLLADGHRLIALFPKVDNAVLAALEMRDRVAQLPPLSGVSLAIRILIHTCDVATEEPTQNGVDAAIAMSGSLNAGQIMVSIDAATLLSERLRHHLDTSRPVPVNISGENRILYPLFPALGEAVAAPASAAVPNELCDADDRAPGQPVNPRDAQPLTTRRPSLLVRYNSTNFVLSDTRPVLLAGREEGNDLVIQDRRASRHHARIEWRQNRFVLVDTSTNGTHLIDADGKETVLRRREADLPERGRIGFGFSPKDTRTDAVVFNITPP